MIDAYRMTFMLHTLADDELSQSGILYRKAVMAPQGFLGFFEKPPISS
jgi:hypothetical protein